MHKVLKCLPWGHVLLGMMFLLSGCATTSQNKAVNSPQIDRISEAELARIVPKTVVVLTLDDIVRLTHEGNSADQIIDQIKASNSLYDLTPSQSIELSRQGVDSRVLDYIYTSRELAWRNGVADEINKREKAKRTELEKLKRQQLQQQQLYDASCQSYYRLHPYGYYGPRFRPRVGIGAGYVRPWGCW